MGQAHYTLGSNPGPKNVWAFHIYEGKIVYEAQPSSIAIFFPSKFTISYMFFLIIKNKGSKWRPSNRR